MASLQIVSTSLGDLNVIELTNSQIPGATWTASGLNQHIQAHGGGIIQVGST